MAICNTLDILHDAQKRGRGICFFNTLNIEMVRACISIAEEMKTPIIIGTAEGLLKYSELEWIAPIMVDAAKNASVPVAVHLDHAYNFEVIMRALRCGFSSVMFDGSQLPYKDNVEKSANIVKISHAMGVSVECELGCVGGLSDENNAIVNNLLTDPSLAKDFVEKTQTDFLAVSVGSQHGVYKTKPSLDFNRLELIRKNVSLPLVLHGGSGLSDDDFAAAIEHGIVKINIYTDVVFAGQKAVEHNILCSYPDMMKAAEDAMKDAIRKKIATISRLR